jgi:ABC-type multidrug transport system ATPase subunit
MIGIMTLFGIKIQDWNNDMDTLKPETKEKLITLENATKEYKGKRVIDSVSHVFFKGDSIAFYGHNGSGKSTMLKLLSGLIPLSDGEIHYHKDLRFSYVPEKFAGMEIEMIEYLEGIARVEGVDHQVVDDLIKDFFLDSMIHTRMDKLSKGSLQKVGVIQAIMAPKDVILLDEPLSGQDADSQAVFISKIKELRKQGITIFMSCHEKRLIDELSDKVFTIDNGKLVQTEYSNDILFKVCVRAGGDKPMWPNMHTKGDRYEMTVEKPSLKDNVLRLYQEGWEIVGIEECN